MVEERERVKQIPKKLKIVAIILAALLRADFAWYVKDEGGLTPPPTGDTTNMVLWIILAVSALLLLLLAFWRRKEARHE